MNEESPEPKGIEHSSSPLIMDEELQKEFNNIPDRMAFKIGDVAKLLDVKSYVLRYWETEFDTLRPKKSQNNQRIYKRKDVETLILIKKLLYKDRFSIEGARTALKNIKRETRQGKKVADFSQEFESFKNQVEDVLTNIKTIKSEL